MKKSAELVRFENKMSESEEFRKQFEEAIKRIVENKQAESDGEVFTKAAAELGYELSIAELERVSAEMQDLSDEELESVAGGMFVVDKWCMLDYYCYTAARHEDHKDEPGRHDRACWSDWDCMFVSNENDYA